MLDQVVVVQSNDHSLLADALLDDHQPLLKKIRSFRRVRNVGNYRNTEALDVIQLPFRTALWKASANSIAPPFVKITLKTASPCQPAKCVEHSFTINRKFQAK